MDREPRGGKKRGKRKMTWPRLDAGDCRLLLLVELALARGEETLIGDPQEGTIGIGIGGMTDVLNLMEGIEISMIGEGMIEIIVEIQGIGLAQVLDQGYVQSPSLRIDAELINRHLNHLPTALQTHPHPSLLDSDPHPDELFRLLAVLVPHPDEHFRLWAVLDPLPDAHFLQSAVLDPLRDAHYHQLEDQDPHLGHKVIPTDPIGMAPACLHLEELGILGRSLLNQCLMRYVFSYLQWSVLMNSSGDHLENDLLPRE